MKMNSPKLPELCEDMADVREGVDDVDRQIVSLLVRRFGYMDAAARIKQERETVRDEKRKAQVLDNVRQLGKDTGLPDGLTDELWENLIERSIAYEFVEWDRQRA